MKSKLEIALSLAEQGFYVFPLPERQKKPPPKGWQKIATRDAAKITELWTSIFGGEPRNLNIGIATEPSGLIVIDVDTKEGKRGDLDLARLEAEHGPLPAAMRVRTPTGGVHIYLRGPTVRSRVGGPRSPFGHGIDIRSHGAYVVAPGSETADGRYEVIG